MMYTSVDESEDHRGSPCCYLGSPKFWRSWPTSPRLVWELYMTDLWCSFLMSVFLTMNFSSTHLYPGNCYLASMDFKRSLYTRLSSLSHSFYVSPISLSFLFFFSFCFKYFSLKPRSSVTLTSLHHWSSTLKYTLNILWLIPYKSIPYTHTTSTSFTSWGLQHTT